MRKLPQPQSVAFLPYYGVGASMDDFDIARSTFLNTELKTGLMFCRIALRTKDPAKRERNRINARKAYKSLSRFSKDVALSPSQARALRKGTAELKRLLDRLAKRT
jgi:hypothetical protein